MVGGTPQTEWYLARDGQQYGPLSDVEMRKFVELGYLRPTDLVWRHGFADWRPAPAVFPARPMPPQRPATRHPGTASGAPDGRSGQGARHVGGGATPGMSTGGNASASRQQAVAAYAQHEDEPSDIDDDFIEPRPRRGRKLAIALLLIILTCGAGWFAYTRPDVLASLMHSFATSGSREPPAEQLRTTPFQLAGSGPDEIDRAFQQTALWRLMKREFPDWYAQQLNEAVRLKSEKRDDEAIARHLAEAIVALRRKHASEALAASPTAVRTIAAKFLDNVKHLAGLSVEACYGFISQGEVSPHVLGLINTAEHVKPLHNQVYSVFSAVAEGRRSPQAHLPPRKTDYEALTQALRNRGWSDRDLQLFSDPRALSRATPEQVCNLVQDWFAAQLSISDDDVQLRLLVESLKPVVAG